MKEQETIKVTAEDKAELKENKLLHQRYVVGGEISEVDFQEVEKLVEEDEGIRVINLAADSGEDALPETKYSFLVFYKPPKGLGAYKKGTKILHGVFSARIPSVEDNISLGRLKARYRGGLPMEAMDIEDNLRIEALAKMHILLESHPPWFDLDNLYDERILAEIQEKMLERESLFQTGSITLK